MAMQKELTYDEIQVGDCAHRHLPFLVDKCSVFT